MLVSRAVSPIVKGGILFLRRVRWAKRTPRCGQNAVALGGVRREDWDQRAINGLTRVSACSRPARKGGSLLRTAGLLKEELLQLRHRSVIEGAEPQIKGYGPLMLGDRRLPFAVEFDQPCIKPQLPALSFIARYAKRPNEKDQGLWDGLSNANAKHYGW